MSVRTEQDLSRGRHAAALVQQSGGSALEAACAHITATFAPASRHSIYKDRVAALIAGGYDDEGVCTRYQRIAERYSSASLDGAIAVVDRLRQIEYQARADAIQAWGQCGRPRLALMVLDELRLILRLLRRYAPARYPAILAAILTAQAHSSRPTGRPQADFP